MDHIVKQFPHEVGLSPTQFTTLNEFQQIIESSLKLDLPYARWNHRDLLENDQEEAVPAAVLLLFGSSIVSTRFSASLLYTRRTDTVETHKGQIAFPGGLSEEGDREGPVGTALRETEEEVGIPRSQIRVIGQLPSLLTVTGYLIRPFVGILKEPVEKVELHLNPAETAEAMWIQLETLIHPDTYRNEFISAGTEKYSIDVFQVEHHRIWGATGSMTKNLLDRIRKSAELHRR